MSIQGLNTSYSAIRAAQAALDTISHNIANVTTKGYTRQRADLVSLSPYDAPAGLMGQGVDVTSISRQRDQFLDEQARTEDARLTAMQARAGLLQQAELRFGELDVGVDTALTQVFDALEELSLHPDSTPVRTTVLDAMEGFAARVRNVAEGLRDLGAVANLEVRNTLGEANDLIGRIAELNGRIGDLSAKGVPNDLLDQRDVLVDQLAQLTGATTLPGANNSVRVSLNGLSLVDGQVPTLLSQDLAGNVVHPDGPIAVGGQLGGLATFRTVDLPAMVADLDAFATAVADAFNAQNAAGFTAPGTAGGPLFDASGGAAGLTLLAASPADLAVAGDTAAATFDGDNAARLAALRTTDPGGGTLLERFRDVVGDVGVLVARADADVRTQQALRSTAATARESQHGVNLDEEMAGLIAHQRALEAAARVMTAVDEALNTLINRTGLVGR